MAENDNDITISVLKFPDNVREAPEIYIDNINHGIYEIIDNSIDEHLAGFCDKIIVGINEKGYIFVQDNGRGIPVSPSGEEDLSSAELALSTLAAGGKFKSITKGQLYASAGKNGVGSSCVNALADYFEADICRDGKTYQIIFNKGKFVQRQKEIGVSSTTGTKILYHPDPEIYGDDQIDISALKERLRQSSYLNPGLTFEFMYIDDNKPVKEEYKSDNGLLDFLGYISGNKEKLFDNSIDVVKDVESIASLDNRSLKIEVAFGYLNSYSTDMRGFVNGLYSADGGNHVTGFNAGIAKTVRNYALEHKAIKQIKDFEIADTIEGIYGVISVRIKNPRFNAQNKRKLDMPAVGTEVANAVYDIFYDYLGKNPKEAEIIVNKALAAKKTREAVKRAREASRNLKNASKDKTLTLGKLSDCSSKNPEECELYLVEGDSAAGSAKMGRDPKTQAILPIFGKILNVLKAKENVSQIIKNEKLGLAIAALGCGFGDSFDITKLRYHKIIPFSDADYYNIVVPTAM